MLGRHCRAILQTTPFRTRSTLLQRLCSHPRRARWGASPTRKERSSSIHGHDVGYQREIHLLSRLQALDLSAAETAPGEGAGVTASAQKTALEGALPAQAQTDGRERRVLRASSGVCGRPGSCAYACAAGGVELPRANCTLDPAEHGLADDRAWARRSRRWRTRPTVTRAQRLAVGDPPPLRTAGLSKKFEWPWYQQH